MLDHWGLKSSLSFSFLIGLAILAGCASQQLQLGIDAFEQGNYDVAASHWNPLAENGNPYAQYNIGLLWEGGLGSTEKNINEASHWYLRSAQQGFVPAMVRLANTQRSNGFHDAALSWYVLAARWGNQDAVSALSAWGKAIPQADLQQQKHARDDFAEEQAAEIWGQAAYLLGCALGNASCSSGYAQPSYPSDSSSSSSYANKRRHSASTSGYSDKECLSNYSCGFGYTCVKAPLKNRGVCMRSVNEYGLRQYNNPLDDGVGPNFDLEGDCQFNTDCPIGFRCDKTYRACVRK